MGDGERDEASKVANLDCDGGRLAAKGGASVACKGPTRLVSSRSSSRAALGLARPNSSHQLEPRCLPGATKIWDTLGLCSSFQASACSLPPAPTMRILRLCEVLVSGAVVRLRVAKW